MCIIGNTDLLSLQTRAASTRDLGFPLPPFISGTTVFQGSLVDGKEIEGNSVAKETVLLPVLDCYYYYATFQQSWLLDCTRLLFSEQKSEYFVCGLALNCSFSSGCFWCFFVGCTVFSVSFPTSLLTSPAARPCTGEALFRGDHPGQLATHSFRGYCTITEQHQTESCDW